MSSSPTLTTTPNNRPSAAPSVADTAAASGRTAPPPSGPAGGALNNDDGNVIMRTIPRSRPALPFIGLRGRVTLQQQQHQRHIPLHPPTSSNTPSSDGITTSATTTTASSTATAITPTRAECNRLLFDSARHSDIRRCVRALFGLPISYGRLSADRDDNSANGDGNVVNGQQQAATISMNNRGRYVGNIDAVEFASDYSSSASIAARIPVGVDNNNDNSNVASSSNSNQQKCNIKKKNTKKCKTAVYIAAEGGSTATFMELLRHGASTDALIPADPNDDDNNGNAIIIDDDSDCKKHARQQRYHTVEGTALHAAAISHLDVPYHVTFLLDMSGADVNAVDDPERDRRTPLHWLMLHRPSHTTTATALLAEGADINALDAQGQTPLDLLENSSFSDERRGLLHRRMRDLLERWGGRRNASLHDVYGSSGSASTQL